MIEQARPGTNLDQAVPSVTFSPESRSRALLFAVVALFVSSGCAALIYEIVWFQLLQLTIGSSSVSLAMLLGAYMGGMCLGSAALPRIVSGQHHPLRVYGWLELGIGIFGLLALFGLPYVDRLYFATATPGLAGVIVRGIVSAVCLLPPTILMGASLPAVAREVESTPYGVSWLGYFYGGNIAGAVFGVLLAGFYLLRVHDITAGTYVAVTINVSAALIAFGLARWSGPGWKGFASSESGTERSPAAVPVYIAIALSGL